MKVINHKDSYGSSWDELNETIVKSGDKLRITWPNGTIEHVTVLVKHRIVQNSESEFVSMVNTYFKVKHEGFEISIPLVGLEAEYL